MERDRRLVVFGDTRRVSKPSVRGIRSGPPALRIATLKTCSSVRNDQDGRTMARRNAKERGYPAEKARSNTWINFAHSFIVSLSNAVRRHRITHSQSFGLQIYALHSLRKTLIPLFFFHPCFSLALHPPSAPMSEIC